MRFEKKISKKKIRKKNPENLFAIKFKKIILTTILKKKLYIIKRFFRKRLTKSVNAKNLQIAIKTIYFFLNFNVNKRLNFSLNVYCFKYY